MERAISGEAECATPLEGFFFVMRKGCPEYTVYFVYFPSYKIAILSARSASFALQRTKVIRRGRMEGALALTRTPQSDLYIIFAGGVA